MKESMDNPSTMTGKQWYDKMLSAIGDNTEALALINSLVESIPDFMHINDTHIVVPNEENVTEEQLDSVRMAIMVHDQPGEFMYKAISRNPRSKEIMPPWLKESRGHVNKAEYASLLYALMTNEYIVPKE